MGKVIDLTGQQFGYWTVINKSDKRSYSGGVYWHCKCVCGKEKDVQSRYLRDGTSTSCGCKKAEARKVEERLVGQRFGKLVVKRALSERKNNQIVWECDCDCGNITTATTGLLQQGRKTSCGCNKQDLVNNLIGQRFGKLVVISRAENIFSGGKYRIAWNCQCDCGNTCVKTSDILRSGDSISCGCLSISKGEYIISQLLKQHEISFLFDSCINNNLYYYSKSFPLRFDFIVNYNNNNYIIEYDGEQHFKEVKLFLKDKPRGYTLHERDKIKNQYCFNNNIKLIRIPYKVKLNNLTIEDLLPETSKYLLTPENEGAYYESLSRSKTN